MNDHLGGDPLGVVLREELLAVIKNDSRQSDLFHLPKSPLGSKESLRPRCLKGFSWNLECRASVKKEVLQKRDCIGEGEGYMDEYFL